jgi:hypothetical protein
VLLIVPSRTTFRSSRELPAPRCQASSDCFSACSSAQKSAVVSKTARALESLTWSTPGAACAADRPETTRRAKMPAAAMLTAVSVPTAEPAGEVPPPLVSRRTRDTVLLALRCLYPCKPQRLEGETLILQRTRRRQARDFSGVSPIPTRTLTINLRPRGNCRHCAVNQHSRSAPGSASA